MKIYSISSYIDLLKETNLLVDSYVHDKTLAIENITYNSKEAKELSMFVCKGASFKVEYLKEAVSKNIACYLSQTKYDLDTQVSYIIVSDVRKAMALLADFFYDKAYEKLNLIGITGTKGKSTTAYYIKYILDEYLQSIAKKPSAIVSSIDVYDGKIQKEAHLTTPEALELHNHFDNAVKSGIDFFEMEVSSQALKYDRVLGVIFDVCIFLNISEDHISPVEHSDFEDYLSAKLKIFEQSKTAIVNLESDYIDRVLSASKASPNVITVGFDKKADVYGYNICKDGNEIHFNAKTKDFDEEFCLTMPGLFNVENALAAIATANHFNIPIEFIKKGLKKARSSGRMEIFTSADNQVIAIVDYAHNKLSFTKLYESIKEEYKDRKIITVFGCPGGKAYNRRNELGELSGKNSDKVYLTAEDPAYEEVAEISADIAQHVKKYDCECYMIDDRGEAIKAAILNAEPNSIVLITGKGNETRQKIKSEYVPCKTDVEYTKEAISIIDDKIRN